MRPIDIDQEDEFNLSDGHLSAENMNNMPVANWNNSRKRIKTVRQEMMGVETIDMNDVQQVELVNQSLQVSLNPDER